MKVDVLLSIVIPCENYILKSVPYIFSTPINNAANLTVRNQPRVEPVL